MFRLRPSLPVPLRWIAALTILLLVAHDQSGGQFPAL